MHNSTPTLTTSSKRHNLQGREIRLSEYINFEIFSPGKDFDEIRSTIHQAFVLGT